jgi:hypothetical protein
MVSIPINKKYKLGPKTIDCILLGYAHHSTTYKSLVIKSDTPDILVDSLMESRDITFFENIFPKKDAYSLPSSSNEFILEPTLTIEPTENPHENKEDDSGVAPRRSERQRLQNPLVKTSLCTSWMILPQGICINRCRILEGCSP